MSGIALQNLTIGYERQPVLERINGSFALGTATALVGPNGAGKSTLLKALVGTLRPLSGAIEFTGCTRADIAYLPQRAEIDRSFPITVLDLVLLGHWRWRGGFRGVDQPLQAQARAMLVKVGLVALEDRLIAHLSIGQFQRALFARVMVQDAPIILLDEPFAAMDHDNTEHLLQLMREWRTAGRTVIAALHDLHQVETYFPETVLIDRAITAWGPTAAMLAKLEHEHRHVDPHGDEPARWSR
jgi:zinc/manganese transport system ATP-binding protein